MRHKSAFSGSMKSLRWTVQAIQITRGLGSGLARYIAGPYLYLVFNKVVSPEKAFLYATISWAIYLGLIAVFEVPTGALADTLGRKFAVISGFVMEMIKLILMILLFFCSNFITIVFLVLLTRILGAFSYAIFNGSFHAWVVDRMREIDPTVGYERMFARSQVYSSSVHLVGALLGITMLLQGIPFVAYLTSALLYLGCITYCLGVMEETASLAFLDPRSSLSLIKKNMILTMKNGIKACNQTPVLWCVISGQIVYLLLAYIFTYLWPITLGAQFGINKWSYEWYSIIIAIPIISTVVSQVFAWSGDYIQAKKGRRISNTGLRRILFITYLFASIPIIILGMYTREGVTSFFIFALTIIVVESIHGVLDTSSTTLINNYLPAKNAQERATVLSLANFFTSTLTFFLIVPFSGGSAEKSPVGWIIPAVLLLITAFITNNRIKAYEKKGAKNDSEFMVVEKQFS